MTVGADIELDDLRGVVRKLMLARADDAAVHEWDASKTFPEDVYAALAGLGLCDIATDDGQSALDDVSLAVVIEELARASGALTWAYLATVAVTARALSRHGSPAARERWLPAIASGSARAAIAFSEPAAGSDLGALSTSAVRDGDDYVVRGQKVFCTGADTAAVLLTYVRTESGSTGSSGLSALLVPRDADGVTVRPLDKLAGQALHTCEVFLDDVRAPTEWLLAEPGQGFEVITGSLNSERIACAAQALGIAQGALDKATTYAMEREQFGRPIIDHQAIGHSLADMTIRTDAARLLTTRAATLSVAGQSCSTEAAAAKVYASETARFCAERGMQILGGYSYMTEYGMERYWRECKLYEIAAGTNEVLRNHILSQIKKRHVRR